MSSPPASPDRGLPTPTSPAAPNRHDNLSIFTPVKRNTANPLFLPSPSSTATPSPAKRPRLDFGRDQNTQAGPSRRPPDLIRETVEAPPDDLLALFDDDDDDDDRSDHGLNRGNMTIQHGTEEGGLNGSAMDPYSMGNGSGALIGRDLGVGVDGDADDPGAGEKKRRIMPKMDHDRLLDKNGFPALIQEAKRFKIKGKGHEAADLSNLLEMYRLWAHKMYPKMTFGDTVTKVESLCHSRLMSSTLGRYKEEAKREAEERDRPVIPLELDTADFDPRVRSRSGSVDEQDQDGDRTRTRSIPRDLQDNPFLSPRSRARLALDRARHLGVDVGAGSVGSAQEDDEMDLDAVIAAAEAEAQDLAGPSLQESRVTTWPDKGKAREEPIVDSGYDIPPGFDDDEDDWAALDGM